jgi:hypothetical protein
MARRKKYQCKIGGLGTNGSSTGSGAATLGVNRSKLLDYQLLHTGQQVLVDPMARRKKYQCKINAGGGLGTNGSCTGSSAATLGVNMGLVGMAGAVLLLRDLDNCGEAGGKVYNRCRQEDSHPSSQYCGLGRRHRKAGFQIFGERVAAEKVLGGWLWALDVLVFAFPRLCCELIWGGSFVSRL